MTIDFRGRREAYNQAIDDGIEAIRKNYGELDGVEAVLRELKSNESKHE